MTENIWLHHQPKTESHLFNICAFYHAASAALPIFFHICTATHLDAAQSGAVVPTETKHQAKGYLGVAIKAQMLHFELLLNL